MADEFPIAIRPYEASDLEACRALWRELTERHRIIYEDPTIGGDDPGLEFDAHIALPNLAGAWVAELDGAVVGLTGLLIEGDEGQIEPIVVSEALRSKGIGRRMLEHVVAEAKARGLSSLGVKPVARNVEAIGLFHEAGFRLLGHLDMFMPLKGEREWKPGITIHGREFRY